VFDKLLDFFISIIKIFQFWVVIYPYENGVRLRLGKYDSTLRQGFHWCLPFKIDRVITIDTVSRTLRLGAQSLVTSDKKHIVINSVVTCEILDARKALLNVNSVEHVIDDACSGFVAAYVSENTFDTIVKSCSMPDNSLTNVCRKHAAQFGIRISKVQFTDVTQSRTFRLLNSTNEAASFWGSVDGKKDRL
jgi:regulator of protease activity HflC (stomatin/prohibitin superfamily)